MPSPSNPLTKQQLAGLEQKLKARRKALKAEIAAKLNTQEDPTLLGLRNRMEDTDDWAVADYETAMDVAEVARDAIELQQVGTALTRMKSGDYGVCVDCGVAIPLARLEAYPAAVRCIACQEAREAEARRIA